MGQIFNLNIVGKGKVCIILYFFMWYENGSLKIRNIRKKFIINTICELEAITSLNITILFWSILFVFLIIFNFQKRKERLKRVVVPIL